MRRRPGSASILPPIPTVGTEEPRWARADSSMAFLAIRSSNGTGRLGADGPSYSACHVLAVMRPGPWWIRVLHLTGRDRRSRSHPANPQSRSPGKPEPTGSGRRRWVRLSPVGPGLPLTCVSLLVLADVAVDTRCRPWAVGGVRWSDNGCYAGAAAGLERMSLATTVLAAAASAPADTPVNAGGAARS